MKTYNYFLRILTLIIAFNFQLSIFNCQAQAPQAIPYQAVARDVNGNLIANQNISLRFSLVDQYIIPTTYYQETHSVTTNALGLFTANFGQGAVTIGTFSSIYWGGGFVKYLKVEMDVTGGNSYVDMGSSPLLSVPYSLYSVKSGNGLIDGASFGSTMYWNGGVWDNNTNLYNDGINIGVGTAAPSTKLEVAGTTTTSDLRIINGASSGHILQSDANGNGSWVNPASIIGPEIDPKVGSVMTNKIARWNGVALVDGSVFDNGNVGIGTITPSSKLDVAGTTTTANFKMTSGASENYILQSDATGNASWVNPASVSGAETDPEVSSAATNAVPKWNGAALTDGSIYDNGKVGIGTSVPEFKLSLDNDGGILAKGTFGSGATLTISGIGSRLIWYPKKAAFRAGYSSGNGWDDDRIGDYSFAAGSATRADGSYSTALGNQTWAEGNNSTAMGMYSWAREDYSTAMGFYAHAFGQYSTAIGKETVANGNSSVALGYQTIAGANYSFASGYQSEASGNNSTAMGLASTAEGEASTALGFSTTATGNFSTAMGVYSDASGTHSIAIGDQATASGFSSTAMGYATTASGDNSTALGSHVSTNGREGAFIIGDYSTFDDMYSLNDNGFKTRFAGGYALYSNAATTSGVFLAPGSSSWTTVSDRNKKENFTSINNEDILAKIGAMTLTNWNYKAQAKDIRHIGPMAQDFYAAFHLDGESDTTINTIDIDGINMAAIQALKVRTDELKKAVDKISELTTALANLEQRVNALAKQEEVHAASASIASEIK
jgi:hypothetical protein